MLSELTGNLRARFPNVSNETIKLTLTCESPPWKEYSLIWAIYVCTTVWVRFLGRFGLKMGLDFDFHLLRCLRKWKPFLVSRGHILEPSTNLRGLKWGNNAFFRSETRYGKSQILV